MRVGRATVAISWAVFSLLACVSVQVTTEQDPVADFSRYASYSQAPAPEDDPEKPHYTPEIGVLMQREIDTSLRKKGYRRTESTPGDLTVGFLVSGQTRTRMVNASDPDSDFYVPEQLAEGTLVISVFDSRSGRRVWRGTAETEIVTSGALLTDSPERAALKAVERVLSDFPEAGAGPKNAATNEGMGR